MNSTTPLARAMLLAACIIPAMSHAADPLKWGTIPLERNGHVIGRSVLPVPSIDRFCLHGIAMCTRTRSIETHYTCVTELETFDGIPMDGPPLGGPCSDFSCEPDPEGSPAWGGPPQGGGIPPLARLVAMKWTTVTEEDHRFAQCVDESLGERLVSGNTMSRAPEMDAFCQSSGRRGSAPGVPPIVTTKVIPCSAAIRVP